MKRGTDPSAKEAFLGSKVLTARNTQPDLVTAIPKLYHNETDKKKGLAKKAGAAMRASYSGGKLHKEYAAIPHELLRGDLTGAPIAGVPREAAEVDEEEEKAAIAAAAATGAAAPGPATPLEAVAAQTAAAKPLISAADTVVRSTGVVDLSMWGALVDDMTMVRLVEAQREVEAEARAKGAMAAAMGLAAPTGGAGQAQGGSGGAKGRQWYPGLRVLNLTDALNLTDVGLKVVADAAADSLVSITLSQCHRLTDNGIRILASTCNKLTEVVLDGCARITAASIAALADCCPGLRVVSFEGCGAVEDWALRRLGDTCHSLTHINVARCTKLTDTGLRDLATGCPLLQHVDLSHCSAVTEAGVRALASSCPALRWLSLKRTEMAHRVTDTLLLALSEHCPSLETLILAGCEAVTDVGVQWLARGCGQLRELDLAGAREVGEGGCLYLAEHCPYLQKLVLRNCKKIGDVALRFIAKGCPRLQHLDVSNCYLLSDGKAPSLSTDRAASWCINVFFALQAAEQAAAARPSTTAAVAQMAELLKQREGGSNGSPAAGFAASAAGAAASRQRSSTLLAMAVAALRLQKARDELPWHADETIVGLQAIAVGCPFLRHLDVAGCMRVGDAVITALNAFPARKLSYLSLAACTRPTARPLRALIRGAGRTLRHLNLKNVDGGVDNSVCEAIGASCPRLHALNLTGCTRFSDKALLSITAGCFDIKHLSLDGCSQLTDLALFYLSDWMEIAARRDLLLAAAEEEAAAAAAAAAVAASNGGKSGTSTVAATSEYTSGVFSATHKRAAAPGDAARGKTLLLSPSARVKPHMPEQRSPPHAWGLYSLSARDCDRMTDTGMSWLADTQVRILQLNVRGTHISRGGVLAVMHAWDGDCAMLRDDLEYLGIFPLQQAKQRRFIKDYGTAWTAASKIQALFRGRMARKRALQARAERLRAWACTKIQSNWRSKRQRKKYLRMRYFLSLEERSAIKIQSVYRMRKARREAEARRAEEDRKRTLRAVRMFQRAWRRRKLRSLDALAKAARRDAVKRRYAAAVLIQRHWRGLQGKKTFNLYLASKEILNRARQQAALQIQRVLRGKLARKAAEEERRIRQEELAQQSRAALAIQTRVRTHLARKARRILQLRQEIRHRAALWIQTRWRMKKGKLAAHMLKQARAGAAEEAAALRVQQAWRRRQGRYSQFILQRAREARLTAMDGAARRMQRIWRGHRARRQARQQRVTIELQALKQRNIQAWAATAIQRRWRGTLGRRRAAAKRKERAELWAEAVDDSNGKPFYYNTVTGERRWRRPQLMLELLPKPVCSNCEGSAAMIECRNCAEWFCQDCFNAVHYGGKRRGHVFRAVYDVYGRRVDYGEGDWPSLWPSEVQQDEYNGWTALDKQQMMRGSSGSRPGSVSNVLAIANAALGLGGGGGAGGGGADGGFAVPSLALANSAFAAVPDMPTATSYASSSSSAAAGGTAALDLQLALAGTTPHLSLPSALSHPSTAPTGYSTGITTSSPLGRSRGAGGAGPLMSPLSEGSAGPEFEVVSNYPSPPTHGHQQQLQLQQRLPHAFPSLQQQFPAAGFGPMSDGLPLPASSDKVAAVASKLSQFKPKLGTVWPADSPKGGHRGANGSPEGGKGKGGKADPYALPERAKPVRPKGVSDTAWAAMQDAPTVTATVTKAPGDTARARRERAAKEKADAAAAAAAHAPQPIPEGKEEENENDGGGEGEGKREAPQPKLATRTTTGTGTGAGAGAGGAAAPSIATTVARGLRRVGIPLNQVFMSPAGADTLCMPLSQGGGSGSGSSSGSGGGGAGEAPGASWLRLWDGKYQFDFYLSLRTGERTYDRPVTFGTSRPVSPALLALAQEEGVVPPDPAALEAALGIAAADDSGSSNRERQEKKTEDDAAAAAAGGGGGKSLGEAAMEALVPHHAAWREAQAQRDAWWQHSRTAGGQPQPQPQPQPQELLTSPVSALASPWSTHVDPSTGAPYHYNTATGESVWATEEEAAAIALGTPAPIIVSPGPEVGSPLPLLTSNTAYSTAATTAAANMAAAGAWGKFYDASQGAYYYFNFATGESQWDQPADWAGEGTATATAHNNTAAASVVASPGAGHAGGRGSGHPAAATRGQPHTRPRPPASAYPATRDHAAASASGAASAAAAAAAIAAAATPGSRSPGGQGEPWSSSPTRPRRRVASARAILLHSPIRAEPEQEGSSSSSGGGDEQDGRWGVPQQQQQFQQFQQPRSRVGAPASVTLHSLNLAGLAVGGSAGAGAGAGEGGTDADADADFVIPSRRSGASSTSPRAVGAVAAAATGGGASSHRQHGSKHKLYKPQASPMVPSANASTASLASLASSLVYEDNGASMLSSVASMPAQHDVTAANNAAMAAAMAAATAGGADALDRLTRQPTSASAARGGSRPPSGHPVPVSVTTGGGATATATTATTVPLSSRPASSRSLLTAAQHALGPGPAPALGPGLHSRPVSGHLLPSALLAAQQQTAAAAVARSRPASGTAVHVPVQVALAVPLAPSSRPPSSRATVTAATAAAAHKMPLPMILPSPGGLADGDDFVLTGKIGNGGSGSGNGQSLLAAATAPAPNSGSSRPPSHRKS